MFAYSSRVLVPIPESPIVAVTALFIMSLFDRSSVGLAMDLDEQEAPLARLIRAWTNERHSPDLLVFQGDLLDGLLQKLHEQVCAATR